MPDDKTIAIISHPDCALHRDQDGQHPESAQRVITIDQALKAYPFKHPVQFHLAPLATYQQIYAVHDKEYVDWLVSIAPRNDEYIAVDADTYMNKHTLDAALRAAGATCFAVDLVMKQAAQVAFCNVRPPGHHAERDRAMGFCFFNNVAVGVMHAFNTAHLKRIVIVDFDVHHGNGTQMIFQRNKQVMYCSSFESPFYPGYDDELDNKHILSVPLPAGTRGAAFREAVSVWFDKIAAFEPQLIFFSAGFDAHAKDPLADLNLNKEDYVWLTQHIANLAAVHAEGRLVSVLEGGYSLDALAECVPAHVEAMIYDTH